MVSNEPPRLARAVVTRALVVVGSSSARPRRRRSVDADARRFFSIRLSGCDVFRSRVVERWLFFVRLYTLSRRRQEANAISCRRLGRSVAVGRCASLARARRAVTYLLPSSINTASEASEPHGVTPVRTTVAHTSPAMDSSTMRLTAETPCSLERAATTGRLANPNT